LFKQLIAKRLIPKEPTATHTPKLLVVGFKPPFRHRTFKTISSCPWIPEEAILTKQPVDTQPTNTPTRRLEVFRKTVPPKLFD
jgi:hypothetical protein